ncbi:MAG: biotin--[acetyl-CoA-carboxylase] ligase [Micrococcales bacterium]
MAQTQDFVRTRPLAGWFGHVTSIDSTNRELLQGAAELPGWAVLVADLQTSGRGRSGRQWEAPAGSSMLASVLIRPIGVQPTEFAWIPLIAGLSMVDAIASLPGGVRADVKWPNDVLIHDQKVCGILSELLADLSGVVVGSGANVFQNQDELPIETATSLRIAGAQIAEIDELLSAYLNQLQRNLAEFESLAGELEGSDLLTRIKAACTTIGRDVRVILPNATEFLGVATDIDGLGRLVVRGSTETLTVSAGDVMHLRHN